MSEMTPRFALPLLSAGQAQKEITHNEALLLADALVSPVVVAIAPPAIPSTPSPGQCWIVGAAATGVWQGRDNAIACWTAGGWRFAVANNGMKVWSLADNVEARFNGTAWVKGQVEANEIRIAGIKTVGAQQAAIANVSGGTTIDTQARIAVGAILSALRAHGLIAT
jgi:hypothetical protein